MKHPLSDEEQARVHAAVAAVERRTSARFVLALVPVSERYLLYPLAWSAVIALLATGALALALPDLPMRDGFLADAGLFLALTFLLDWLPIRLRLVPRRVQEHHAHLFAHREFAARILASTQHRNGVLFFVSLGERYVEVIADRDIHARVGEGTWERIVADFVAAVKSGRLANGFMDAVEACAAVLETHYPPEP